MTALVSAVATPAAAWFGRRVGFVVEPRPDRWHRRATPLLGGAAIALAALVAITVALPFDLRSAVLVVCAAGAFVLGLADDFRRFAPSTKLVGQVLVASVLAFGGIEVEIITSAPIAFVVTVFWLVGLMNAINLLDNMDGLAAGVVAIAALGLGVTAIPGAPTVAIVCGAIAGAALGYLPYNFFPARIFMGDAGSLFLGFLLGAAALMHTASGAANLGLAVLGPIVVLALPIFDTALVTTMRRLAGRPIARGGRDHSSHRLAAIGLSDRDAVLALYAIATALALGGIVVHEVSALIVPFVVLAAIALILFGAFLGDVDVYEPREVVPGSADFSRALRLYGRFGAEVGMDVVLLTTAYYLAHLIRFEGVPTSAWIDMFVRSIPVVVGLQLAALVALGVYRTLWRYLGVDDAVTILRALVFGSGAAALVLLVLYRFEGLSRAVFPLDLVLASALIVGSRTFLLWLRHWASSRPREGEPRLLIVGANDSGALAVRLLTRMHSGRPVGFVDDDPGKRYRRVGGVPIVGTTADLKRVIRQLRIDAVVYTGDVRIAERVRPVCESEGVELKEFVVTV